jgi:hypothetical protein
MASSNGCVGLFGASWRYRIRPQNRERPSSVSFVQVSKVGIVPPKVKGRDTIWCRVQIQIFTLEMHRLRRIRAATPSPACSSDFQLPDAVSGAHRLRRFNSAFRRRLRRGTVSGAESRTTVSGRELLPNRLQMGQAPHRRWCVLHRILRIIDRAARVRQYLPTFGFCVSNLPNRFCG